MSILDAPITKVAKVLAGSSTPVQIWGGAGAAAKVAGTVVIPAGQIRPDSLLRISGLCNFILPNNAGRAVYVRLNGTAVGQSFPAASLGGLHFTHDLYVLPDLTGVAAYSPNLNDVLSPTGGQGSPFSAHANTKTSVAVDLTGAVTLTIELQPVNGDTAELTGWVVENLSPSAAPVLSVAPSTAVACWGDSLTNGTGASGVLTSYPGQLLSVKRPGKAAANLGIGGQTSAQILARIQADKMRGKHWTSIFWMGRNDVGAADLTSTVMAALNAAVANLSHSRFLIGTVTNASTETTGSANLTAILACNAAITAAYPNNVVQIQSTMATEPDGTIPLSKRSDSVHLNDSGYAQVADLFDAALTAKGW